MEMIKSTSDIVECFFCMMSLSEDEVELGDALGALRVIFPSHKEKMPTDLGMILAVLALAMNIERSEEGVSQMMSKTIGDIRQFVGVAKMSDDGNIEAVGKHSEVFIGKKGAKA
jgi:hypothetical protein